MYGIKDKLKKSKEFTLNIAVIFIIVCVSIGIVCFAYYGQVKSTVRVESKDYMHEISTQMGGGIGRNIQDNFSALETIAISLKEIQDISFEDLSIKVDEYADHWNYNKIYVADHDGNTYNKKGDKVRLSGDVYLQETLGSGRNPSMSASEVIDGEECIVFAIPISIRIQGANELAGNLEGEPVFAIRNVDTKVEVNAEALIATYSLDTFDSTLSMSAFNSEGYAHIVRSNGSVVIGSSSTKAFEIGSNLLNSIEKNADIPEENFKTLKNNINNGVSGFVELKVGGVDLYMSHINLDASIESGDWRLALFVPVEVVNVKSLLLLNLTLALCSTVMGLFTVLLAIILFVTYKNRKKLEYIAYVDDVTEGNTIRLFYEVAEKCMQSAVPGDYALLYINIEKFKLLNEQYGKAKCDNLLRSLSKGISGALGEDECIGRLFADNFCVLVKYTKYEVLLERIKNWKIRTHDFMQVYGISSLLFMIEFGVCVILDTALSIEKIVDRAKLALSEVKPIAIDNWKFAVYNDELREKLVREKHLEDMMEKALLDDEFLVYLQPKYSAATERIAGAEALVRWQSKDEGMIYPNEFIPIFEKNGFINKLDLFVFEQTCKTIKKWIDKGLTPMKVSVNCSREHLSNAEFLTSYEAIADKYNVPHHYLEIEFTENIVFGDVTYFSGIIDRIHTIGFGCSMDDFGSGYSSLSLIQDIPVDTIKLDKVFFRKKFDNTEHKTESVVASIINMSKSLEVTTVAEGVEEKGQFEMLQRLGCDLIQGYYFAKPMTISDFEVLAFGEIIEGEVE